VGGVSAQTALATAWGAYTLNAKTETQSGQTYSASSPDQSSIYVANNASLTLADPTVSKTGDTSSSDYSSYYGLNAGVLALSGSQVTINGGTVTTRASGANGVFSTGGGTSVTLSNLTIQAEGDGAHAVMATQGGSLTLANVDMNTTAAHSGAIATDRGGGTITVSGGTVTTSGQDSPAIYSTGAISVAGATLSASGAEAAVIEGANSITLTDSSLSSSLAGKWGVMIYQSFSGDAQSFSGDAQGTNGVFTMSGGSLAYSSASGPLFYVTNTTGRITLQGVKVTAASGVLLQAAGNDRWGASGANGGTALLSADAQTLSGNLVADGISSLALTLQNGSTWSGAINTAHTAKSASLALDSASTWNVTADSYLTSLSDDGGISGATITNIAGNGHTVYYDASVNSQLGGQTYSLAGGGSLRPEN
jgi:hypothetical protein